MDDAEDRNTIKGFPLRWEVWVRDEATRAAEDSAMALNTYVKQAVLEKLKREKARAQREQRRNAQQQGT